MIYKLIEADVLDVDKLIEYKENNIFKYASDLPFDEVQNIKRYVRESIPRQIQFYKMIIVNGIKVGCLLVYNKDDGVILDEIYIDEEYRNKGIGTNIIKQILLDNKIVYLWVYKLNERAVSLYKKLGFYVLKETESRYYMKYRRWMV